MCKDQSLLLWYHLVWQLSFLRHIDTWLSIVMSSRLFGVQLELVQTCWWSRAIQRSVTSFSLKSLQQLSSIVEAEAICSGFCLLELRGSFQFPAKSRASDFLFDKQLVVASLDKRSYFRSQVKQALVGVETIRNLDVFCFAILFHFYLFILHYFTLWNLNSDELLSLQDLSWQIMYTTGKRF